MLCSSSVKAPMKDKVKLFASLLLSTGRGPSADVDDGITNLPCH